MSELQNMQNMEKFRFLLDLVDIFCRELPRLMAVLDALVNNPEAIMYLGPHYVCTFDINEQGTIEFFDDVPLEDPEPVLTQKFRIFDRKIRQYQTAAELKSDDPDYDPYEFRE